MSVPLLSPRETNGATGCRDRLQRRDRITVASDMRRVGARSGNDKIIPGDLPAVDAVACGDEFLLGLGIVHQYQVSVPVRRGRQCLPGARASTRTSMPDSSVKIGMMRASSPELSTEVVDANRIDCKVGLSAA